MSSRLLRYCKLLQTWFWSLLTSASTPWNGAICLVQESLLIANLYFILVFVCLFVCLLLFRNCGGSSHCKQICKDPALRQQAPKEVRNLTWTCTESLHVYKRQPTLQDNYDEYEDSRKLGLAVYRHNSRTVAACGPNYCCCRAFQS